MGLFPFIAAGISPAADKELPEYKEMAYDFDNNCLKKKAGKYYLVVKNEALKIWIYKALKTKRFIYQAYSHKYGTEIDNVIGISNGKGIIESEIRRYVTETVMVNPYIQELSGFSYDWKTKSFCAVTFEVATVYDRFTWSSEVYVT